MTLERHWKLENECWKLNIEFISILSILSILVKFIRIPIYIHHSPFL